MNCQQTDRDHPSTSKSHRNFAYVMMISFVAAIGGLLIGFDSSVISGVIEPLSQHYGLSASQTGWAVSSILFGSIIGCYISGVVADKLGRKKALILTAFIFLISVLGTAYATNFYIFITFRVIGGLAMGLATVVSTIYIAEVAPKDFRGTAITMQTICIVGGQVVVLIINYIIAKSATQEWLVDMGWRYMLLSALIPCVLFLVFCIFIPETPRWNVLAGREAYALKTLATIANGDKQHAQSVVDEIKLSLTTGLSKEESGFKLNKQSISFLFIGTGLALFSQLSGINIIQYYGPTLLLNITDSLQQGMYLAIFLVVVQFTGVCIGMYLIDKVGRTILLKTGALLSFVFLVYTFFTFYFKLTGVLSVIGLFGFMFSFGIGWAHAIWTVIGEIFPTRLRAVGAGISLSAMYIGSFTLSQSFPILNKNPILIEKFHGGFPLLLCGIFSLISWLFVKRYVPETKGVSLEKMESTVLKRFNIDSEEHTIATEANTNNRA